MNPPKKAPRNARARARALDSARFDARALCPRVFALNPRAFASAFGLAALSAAMLCVVPAASWAKGGMTLAVVDVQRVVTSTDEWKQAVGQLEKTLKVMQAGIETRKGALQERRQKLDAKKAVSDPRAMAAEEEELVQEEQKLVQEFIASQQRLTSAEGKLKAAMFQRVQQVVDIEGQKGEFSYVFDTGDEGSPNVLYADKRIQITDRIITAYAEAFKGKPLDVKFEELLAPAL